MEEKLRRLMKQEGINSTRLAEMLGIQASGISHIMSGRNKPSYDFLLKLLQRFPQLNPDWLLLDKGPMYRDEIKKSGTPLSSSPQATALQTPSANATTATPTASTGLRSAATPAPSAQTPNPGLFSNPGDRPYDAPAQPNRAPFATERDDEDIIPAASPYSAAGSAYNPAGPGYSSGPQRNPSEHNPADTVRDYPGAGYNPALPPSRGFAPSSSIERIVVFYKDKTFSEYQPA